jgi:beta-galactosidase
VLQERTPGVPVTTNFMAGIFNGLDYWQWAPEVDVVSTDHYLTARTKENYLDLAYAADLTRSLAGGEWLLMEHSTSAVNWQPRNAPKGPGEMIRNSLSHVARGSQGAMFFQWRASAGRGREVALGDGAARRPRLHALARRGAPRRPPRQPGAGARLHRGRTGRAAARLPEHLAEEHPAQPSDDMTAEAEIKRWHAALLRLGITADLARPGGRLDRYRVVFVPSLYLVSDADAANLASYVASGGTVLIGPYSGVVDEFDHVRLGGYPGAFADLLGVRLEEFTPLLPGASVGLDNGARGMVWSERGRATTRHRPGRVRRRAARVVSGPDPQWRAWYIGTRLVDEDLSGLLRMVLTDAGVSAPVADPPTGLEVVRRIAPDATSLLFLVNHSPADIALELAGTDLLTGAEFDRALVPAHGVVVLREAG